MTIRVEGGGIGPLNPSVLVERVSSVAMKKESEPG